MCSEVETEGRHSLRVLILEDVPRDADLQQRELRRDGLEFTARVTEEREEYVAELDSFRPDLILADYNLPRFSGTEALEIRNERCPDVAFVIVTGTIDEETAVGCMKAGADDYVLKERLFRLGPAVRNVVEKMRARSAERKAQQALRMTRFSVDHASDAIFWLGPDGRFQDVNEVACRRLGYTREKLLAMAVHDIDPNFPADAWPQHWEELRRKHHMVFRSIHRTREGTDIPVEVAANYSRFEGREYSFAYVRDVTEHKQWEQRQALHARALATLNRPDEWQDLVRDLLAEIKAFTGLDAVGIRLRQGEDFPYYEAAGFPEDFVEKETYLCARDETGALVRDCRGKPCLECMCGCVIQGRTDPSLPFFTVGGSFWTNSTTQLLASTTEKDRQARTRNRCNGEGYESVALIPLRAGADTVGLLQLNDRRMGRLSLDLVEFLEPVGHSIGIAFTRMGSVEDLRESHEMFRSMVDNIGIGVSLISPAMKVLQLNHQMREWHPRVDPDERPHCYQAFHDPPRDKACENCPTCRTLRDGEVHEETVTRPRAGSMRQLRIVSSPVVDAQGQVAAAIEMVEDITERRALEEQLRVAQKMESIGELAGGVAHDFNNLLTAIRGFAQFAQRRGPGDSRSAGDLEQVLAGVERAERLTRQLLAFSRQQTLQTVVLDVNDVVQNLDKMLERLIGEDIEVQYEVAPDLGHVIADPGQLEQVVLNLALNARNAMPDGGRLRIQTANADLDQTYAERHAGVTPGAYVLVSVADTGCGMDAATLRRVFEPFFTTKEAGRGTGLGLATTHGIVAQHGGHISVDSELGLGTTFRVYLPRSNTPAAANPARAPSSEVLPRGTEALLVVEDDEGVRGLVQAILEEQGYKVLVAASPDEANALLSRQVGELDLLVTDVVMPGRSGPELYEQLSAARTGLKVLYMSGYISDKVTRRGLLAQGKPYLQKPFEPDELVRRVRAVLDG